MALSLLCGGLGVAEATVHVNEGTGVTHEVYTTVETYSREVADAKLDLKADKTDVATNTANIATNADKITKLENDKLDKTLASETYATKDTLNALKDTVNGKADKDAVTTALGDKADKADVYSKTGADDKFATKDALNNKADKNYVDNAVAGAITTAGTNVDAKLEDYAKTTYVDTEVGKKANKATTLAGYGITDAYTKSDVHKRLNEKANKTDLTQAQTEIDGLNAKTTKITYDASNGTSVDGVTFNAGTVTGVTSINGTKIGTPEGGKYISQDGSIWGNMKKVDTQVETNEKNIETNKTAITNLDTKVGTVGTGTYLDPNKSIGENLGLLDTGLKQEVEDRIAADTALSDRIGTVTEDGNYIKESGTNNVSANLKVLDTRAKTNTDAIAKETADREAAIGELAVNGNYIEKDKNVSDNLVELDKQAKTNADAITKTNQRTAGITRDDTKKETSIEGRVTVDTNGNIKAEGTITSNGLDARAGEIKTTGKVSAGDVSTGTLETTGNAKIGGDLTVNGKLNVGEIYMEHKKQESTGKDYDSATAITADGISNRAKVTDENGNTTESKFTHNEKGTFNYAKDEKITGEWKGATSNVTADGVSNKMTDSAGNTHTYYQTAAETKEQLVNGNKSNFERKTAEGNTISIKDKDADGNKKSLTNKQTVDGEKTSVTNKESSSTINQGADQIRNYVASTDGTKSSTEVKADGITNTSDGTITNDANHIENKANTMDTTVTGKATESYGELETTVNGNQTTTVKGNVKEDYKKDLTTTVGGNELHEVTGTKTENVTGKVTENYKGGQETNVTGDQVIKVSGTQTTTATDIKRNASSGMIDTIDNDYGTNTETKVAGKTTTDVSIKGTGEEGKYIRGANESRDYLIKGTLKNSETKTAEATSTEITDGTNKASTIQDAKNLAGSVTNGTETGVSGIHANDDGSVSIDSAVAGGGMSSVINQKKDSIQSAVGDGTNSTVIHQDKDNVTIASSNGMVGLVGKDIVNNAQDTITNTAGTSITNQVNDSKVTTDANGTTFENNTPAVSDGGATTTKINGNQITTGRVDANELGVSDKDGTNTADLSVKAGEGVKASASDGTTTGSLDVTADEVGSTVKDASGKGSTFKQRIDAIMMESKDVSITAEETLTNEAKVITNKASEVINNEAININNTATGIITSKASEIKNQADKLISNKVGENTWENMEDGKITTSIKNGTKQNLTQSDAEKTEHSVVNGSNSTVNKQTSEEITDAVTNGTTTNVTQNTATSSNNTIADKNGNANTVISTVDGTSFINSKAAAPVTGASGAGTAVNTTIKGNTITTGKVTMDYAEVMKDLGVHGNANITGNTTTGSLEVTSTSTLKGDVTMESNATVKNNLTVEGTTKTKTLNVTENATVGGTLDVTGKATFQNDVDITGNVKANSYKVGDKTYIDENGIHANGQKITDVADGSISEGSKDAVNGGQLYNVKNDLEGKVNKVGANAAAMANLHPMEFDPDSKWNIAAAIGNYGSETAAALGAFYRPNDDVMVNLSTAFGTGENMVGGGVSVRLGKGGNKLSREESNALKDQVNDLTARMDALLSVLNPNMSKDFPDVPENHWAYEAVSRLAGNDIVQGYPDGEFHGERTMTRYEMAEIIYNALSRGAEAEKELVEEFKPELQAMAASEKATAERAEG